MSAFEKTKTQVANTSTKQKLFEGKDLVLMMVSGGSDSVAMAYLLSDMAKEGTIGSLAMLHVNHKLRGQDADADAEFCASLAKNLNIPFYLREIDVAKIASSNKANIEACARKVRFGAAKELMEKLCKGSSATGAIAVAHTLNDRMETFYMRSIVGTGPGGFGSLRYANTTSYGRIVRPLLDVTRDELRAYLFERQSLCGDTVSDCNGNLWREDVTNADTAYLRAFVREKMVPLAQSKNASLSDTLRRTMNLIAEEDDMLESEADKLSASFVKRLSETDSQEGILLMPELGLVQTPLLRRVVFNELSSLYESLYGPDGRIEEASVSAVMDAWDKDLYESDSSLKASAYVKKGYVVNIQGDLAVSANSKGVRIEPMSTFRQRRKKD
ncbi:MAG: tRNA lysidine(34) synthetase TilS [Eggerthellaceae bacterium]|nr:tRNA lysidine(34) synthetase TilS [Eggerthellaceae bacterium]